MSRPPVSAPGKAFLIGEYGVLEGVPALVTAVDVRAIAHDPRVPGDAAASSTIVRCAHAHVQAHLQKHGVGLLRAPVVESGGFTLGQRKLGLGSSAAVTAAVVGFHLAEHGRDLSDAQVREQALALALAAHAEAQGGSGSGADVATAVLGGTIVFEQGQARNVSLPHWLHVGFADAGRPAVTSSFVRAVHAGAKRAPGRYRDALALIERASALFIRTVVDGPQQPEAFARIVEATRLHCEALRALQQLGDVPILNPETEIILRAAAAANVAAKPSGAGGGDLVVVFAQSKRELDQFAERLAREHGIASFAELRCGAPGLRAEDRMPTNSRLAGFFQHSIEERRQLVAASTGVASERLRVLDEGRLDVERANHMIENVVGTMGLPLAIATNFRINGKDVLVPMCVEEASVVAAASNAAKMIRAGGGFATHSDPPWMISQIQMLPGSADACTVEQAISSIRAITDELLLLADSVHPRLVERGGGARGIDVRALASDMLVVHVLVDCQDAMGANLLNTVAEIVAPLLEARTGWRAGLKILSNLADRRCSHAKVTVPVDVLAGGGYDGLEVARRIQNASRFAELDRYRAATHNKGIMNGVDAVVLATGNDWRAIEAGAHAYAARDGQYRPLATWRVEDGALCGQLSLPTAVGVVGGATRVHPVARLAIEILGCTSGNELGQVMAAAGLASNLAALRALATEGIQRGHMSLHARSVAMAAGACGTDVETIAEQLIACGEIKTERAIQLLQLMRTIDSSQPGTGKPRL